jgi:predicted nucleotidyltransferase
MFPTPHHRQAAERVADFFKARAGVEAVLVVNSYARGKATPDSDLDMAVLVSPDVLSTSAQDFERAWLELRARPTPSSIGSETPVFTRSSTWISSTAASRLHNGTTAAGRTHSR